MADLNDILLVPVEKEHFNIINQLAEAMMCLKYPKRHVKSVRKLVLREFKKFQQEKIWLSELESDIQNNLFCPKLLRRHSV
jgi:hypothetical protein